MNVSLVLLIEILIKLLVIEQLKMLGELGFMGMMVDPKYGGSGMDTLSYVLQ
jgi:alkylation response protein AidB-like acyl-CoA dehydrogenase